MSLQIAVPLTCHHFWLILSMRRRMRPKLRLIGDFAPTVDVFITCCKEPVDVIMDTTIAVSYNILPVDGIVADFYRPVERTTRKIGSV